MVTNYCSNFSAVAANVGISYADACDPNKMQSIADNIISLWYTDYSPS